MGEIKRGNLTTKEKEQILSLVGKKDLEAIAKELNRKVETVKKYVDENWFPEGTEPGEAHVLRSMRKDLYNSQEYVRLQEELTRDELKYFEERFAKLMHQFKNDALASEQTQIAQSIKLEILMSRNLVARRQALIEISRLEGVSDKFLKSFSSDPASMSEADRNFFMNIESQLGAARMAEQSRTTEYKGLLSEHIKLQDKLKATRDQRIKEVESGKVSMLGLIKMLQQRGVAEREGREAELMKLAGQREYERLGEPHTYDDGSVDLPILCEETLDRLANSEDKNE